VWKRADAEIKALARWGGARPVKENAPCELPPLIDEPGGEGGKDLTSPALVEALARLGRLII
jgi:hypothetical protein